MSNFIHLEKFHCIRNFAFIRNLLRTMQQSVALELNTKALDFSEYLASWPVLIIKSNPFLSRSRGLFITEVLND